MDEIDVAISRALFMNSRISYTDLGKELSLSPQAVHRRVQIMTEAGIIRGTVTRLTPKALGRMWTLVPGWSRANLMDEMVKRLGKYEGMVVAQVARETYDLQPFIPQCSPSGLRPHLPAQPPDAADG